MKTPPLPLTSKFIRVKTDHNYPLACLQGWSQSISLNKRSFRATTPEVVIQAAVSTRICVFILISKEKSDNWWGLEGAIFYLTASQERAFFETGLGQSCGNSDSSGWTWSLPTRCCCWLSWGWWCPWQAEGTPELLWLKAKQCGTCFSNIKKTFLFSG